MKKIVINGHVVEYNTVSELADIMQVLGMSAPTKGGKKPTGAKAPKKGTKAEVDEAKLQFIRKWKDVPFADMPDDVRELMYYATGEGSDAKLDEKLIAETQPKAEKKAEKVDFVKANGETVKATPAQAKAWEAYRNREHKTLDEVKALKPEITDEGRAYVKANPSCTRKDAAAHGCKNITKDGLKALKRELGVR